MIEDESTASNLHENDHVHFYLQILYEKLIDYPSGGR